MSKTLMLMVTAFTFCLLPVICFCIFEIIVFDRLRPTTDFFKFDKNLFKAVNIIGLISNIILMSNSFMNGIIYSLKSWRFRAEAKIFFHRYLLQHKGYKIKDGGRQSSSAATASTHVSTAEISVAPRESWNYDGLTYQQTVLVRTFVF